MKRKTVVMGLTVALAAVLLMVYLVFNRSLTAHLRENTVERLQEIAAPNLISFDLQMQEQIEKVDMFAESLGEIGRLGDESQVKLLQAMVRNNGLLRCVIAFPDGSFVTNEGRSDGNVADREFFLANMRGERYITDPQPSVLDETKTVILFSAPIYQNAVVAGSVIYTYLCDDLEKIFNLKFSDGQGQLAVVKSDGTLLMGGNGTVIAGESLVDKLRTNCTHKLHAAKDCITVSGEQGSCMLSLSGMDTTLLVQYDKLPYNDWYMLTFVPERAAAGVIYSIARDQQILGVFLLVCIVLYAGAVIMLWLHRGNSEDKMTGALTLEGFKHHAKKMLHRTGGGEFVLVKLDIRNFKLINRTYDFETGDSVIRNIANALAPVVEPKGGLFARVGTDDFVILLPYVDRQTLDAQRMEFIGNFQRLMGEHFTTRVEFPTGQYIITEDEFPHPNIDEAFEKANFAHRAAKREDWGHHIVDYVENLEKEALFEKTIEDKMVPALTNEEFQLYLQPKYSVPDEKICGAEALVRWEVNGNFYMHPTAFIPTLERNGFIVKIDYYMFEQAVLRVRSFMDEGVEPVTISVNFSRVHLSNAAFVEELCAVTDKYDVPRRYFEIELTESAVFENVERIVELINQLHAVGFTMSMDDFGSGYSCLALLKDLKVDVVKLDKGFFDTCADPQRARIVVANIMNMAKELGVTTVAEGVETIGQVELLRELGCDMIQGYYYAKPIPGTQFKL